MCVVRAPRGRRCCGTALWDRAGKPRLASRRLLAAVAEEAPHRSSEITGINGDQPTAGRFAGPDARAYAARVHHPTRSTRVAPRAAMRCSARFSERNRRWCAAALLRKVRRVCPLRLRRQSAKRPARPLVLRRASSAGWRAMTRFFRPRPPARTRYPPVATAEVAKSMTTKRDEELGT